ncbi:hypothetical protein SAVCW2_27990 [Streptomyces avermitilis]|nr:hypothetical protein SAVCW2_27990 [Streptomyces avermitilis]
MAEREEARQAPGPPGLTPGPGEEVPVPPGRAARLRSPPVTGRTVKPKTRGIMAVRGGGGLGSFGAYGVAAWGGVSLALITAVAWSHCGPRNECGGRGALVLGPFGIVFGILLEGFAQRKRCYQGPSAFMSIFQSVLVGSAVVFARSVFLAEPPVGWRVFMGAPALLSAGGRPG